MTVALARRARRGAPARMTPARRAVVWSGLTILVVGCAGMMSPDRSAPIDPTPPSPTTSADGATSMEVEPAMSDKPFLDGYSGQTTDELLALADRYRVDSVVLAFEGAIEQKASRVGVDALSDAERTVLAIEALEREVNNDGYLGFFSWRPEMAQHVIGALRAIGRDDVAGITQTAIDALGADDLTEDGVAAAAERDDEARDERLNAADETYYATAGDLAGPLLDYIRANRADISIP